MKKRLLTAAVGIPLVVVLLLVRGWAVELAVTLLTLIAQVECYNALRAAGHKVFPWGGYAAAVGMFPLSQLTGKMDPLLLVLAAMGLTLTGIVLRSKPSFLDAATSLYPLYASLLPMSMITMMINSHYGRVSGLSLVTMGIVIGFAGDAMAYFGGRRFGRHLLCPELSPKKTVEGSVFYFAGSILSAQLLRLLIVHGFGHPMPGVPATLLLGLLGGFAGQIGDLSASLLKRYSGIKDYGSIFPGHGGVMDRFDSVIFVMIVMYCYTLVL